MSVEPEPRDRVTVRVPEEGALEATNGAGATVRMGPPGTPGAFTPVELLLAALGGCGGIDVRTIAAKQRRPLGAFGLTVSGWRAVGEHRVARAQAVYDIPLGEEAERAVRRAVALAAEKYCTVSLTLARGCDVGHVLAADAES